MKNIALSCLAIVVLSACGRFGNSEEKHETVKQERIVSIAKQYNEIIYAIGAEKDLVAVDLSSIYPKKIQELPTVGYHRALSIESILANKPSLIIHDNNIGPEHVVSQLNSLNIPMKVFDKKAEDIKSTKSLIKEIGQYFEKNKAADSICDILDKDMQQALAQLNDSIKKPRVLIVHFGRASNIYLVMTAKSTAAKIIDWAGGEMAVDAERGMRQLSAEVIAQSDPDVILLTDFGYDRLGDNEKIKELPGISSTKAAKNNKIYRINEADIVYLGPRTGRNVLAFRELIHSGNESQ